MKETLINTPNLKLAALTSGKRRDPAVIAIHGWLDNAASFQRLGRLLERVYLVALDLPGHGKSEHRRGTSAYHMVDYATDVVLAAEALGLERFSILGHSMGGAVGAMVAAGLPDRVSRLALLDGLGPLTHEPSEIPSQLNRHFSFAIDSARKNGGTPKLHATANDAIEARHRSTMVGQLSRKAAAIIANRNMVKTTGGYIWNTDRRLLTPSPFYWPEELVLETFAAIQCETLLVKSSDSFTSEWFLKWKEREAKIARLEVITVEGGHHVHIDDPERLAPCLQHFFEADGIQ